MTPHDSGSVGLVSPISEGAAEAQNAASRFSSGELLERAYVVAALLVFFAVGLPVIADPGGTTAVTVGADVPTRIARMAILAVFPVCLLVAQREIVAAIKANGLLALMVMLALASYAWSLDKSVTLRSSMILFASSLFGVYMGTRFTLRTQVQLLTWAYAFIVAISCIYVVATPYGIQPGDYQQAWRGAFIHKNGLGKAMALGVLVFWHAAADAAPRWRIIQYAWMIACGALLILARSAGALIDVLLTFAVISLLPLLRSRRISGWFVGAVVLLGFMVVVSFAAVYWSSLLKVLGKDPTLNGRTVLWALLLSKISLHPALGYGYDAFWHSSRAFYADIWGIVGWMPPHAHNGFLNVALDLGYVGVAMLIAVILRSLGKCFALLRADAPIALIQWPLVYMSYMVVSNLMEVSFLTYANAYWILFVAAAVSSTSTLRDVRQLRVASLDSATV
ncbi:MAG TPA: O-antigen ligase family protein [Gemmatimonadaceae bacterium]|nr:O-antigen ligase family protein [Gemmatimonadaceae bacterium]